MAELTEVPPIILLSSTIIDRYARMIIERHPTDPNKLMVFMSGVEPREYTGDEARELWSFYDRDKGYRFSE